MEVANCSAIVQLKIYFTATKTTESTLPKWFWIMTPRIVHYRRTYKPQAPQHTRHPSAQFDPDPAINPSNPVRRPRGGSREALTARRCTRPEAQGPWITDLCACTLALRPSSRLQVRFWQLTSSGGLLSCWYNVIQSQDGATDRHRTSAGQKASGM